MMDPLVAAMRHRNHCSHFEVRVTYRGPWWWVASRCIVVSIVSISTYFHTSTASIHVSYITILHGLEFINEFPCFDSIYESVSRASWLLVTLVTNRNVYLQKEQCVNLSVVLNMGSEGFVLQNRARASFIPTDYKDTKTVWVGALWTLVSTSESVFSTFLSIGLSHS